MKRFLCRLIVSIGFLSAASQESSGRLLYGPPQDVAAHEVNAHRFSSVMQSFRQQAEEEKRQSGRGGAAPSAASSLQDVPQDISQRGMPSTFKKTMAPESAQQTILSRDCVHDQVAAAFSPTLHRPHPLADAQIADRSGVQQNLPRFQEGVLYQEPSKENAKQRSVSSAQGPRVTTDYCSGRIEETFHPAELIGGVYTLVKVGAVKAGEQGAKLLSPVIKDAAQRYPKFWNKLFGPKAIEKVLEKDSPKLMGRNPILKPPHKGMEKFHTDLSGGKKAAENLFEKYIGRKPEPKVDSNGKLRDFETLSDGRRIEYRPEGKSGHSKIEITNPVEKTYEKITFKD